MNLDDALGAKIRDYVKFIRQILLEHSRVKPAHGDIDTTVSFDDERANYALLQSGWDGDFICMVRSCILALLVEKSGFSMMGLRKGWLRVD